MIFTGPLGSLEQIELSSIKKVSLPYAILKIDCVWSKRLLMETVVYTTNTPVLSNLQNSPPYCLPRRRSLRLHIPPLNCLPLEG